MAYQTGVAASPKDLLTKFVAFLTGLGWTTNLSAAVNATDWRAHLSKGTQYVNLYAQGAGNNNPLPSGSNNYPSGDVGAIHLYLSTAFNGGADWGAQKTGCATYANGVSVATATANFYGTNPITAFHFFADESADNIIMVVERVPEIFVAFCWGYLAKAGNFGGSGAYFWGPHGAYDAFAYNNFPMNIPGEALTTSCPMSHANYYNIPCGFVRADIDSYLNRWIGNSDDNTYSGRVGASCVASAHNPPDAIPHYKDLQARLTSVLSGETLLLPVRFYGARDASVGGYSLLGTVPMIFASNAVGNGYSAGQAYQLGADTYMLFPNFAIKKV